MSDFGMIMAPSAPNWLQIRSLESSYQVAMIADDPANLRRFIVATQAMQTQALLNTNTQLAQVNIGIFGIQRGIGELNSSVQEGFSNLSNTMQQGLGELSGQLSDMSYAISEGLTQRAKELRRRHESMNKIARLLSARLEGEAKEIRNSALSAVREGCAPEAFDQEGSLREALKLMKITVEHPMGMRDYVAWFNIGWLLWKLDSNLEDAEKAFATAVRQSMDKKDAYYVMAARHLAYMRYFQGKTDAAYQGIRLALQTAEKDTDNLYTLMLIAAKAGNADEVVSTFRTLIQDHPNNLFLYLAEKELEPYSKQIQHVIDELIQNGRSIIQDLSSNLNNKLNESKEIAKYYGLSNLISSETQKSINDFKQMPIEDMNWPALHKMPPIVQGIIQSIENDMMPYKIKMIILKSMDWIEIPAGKFKYGEKTQGIFSKGFEQIWIDGFKIMKHPVTVRQYRLFCEATNRKMPGPPSWGWIDDHPIVNVTWHDAAAFAEWVGGSLPTEKQWEKAACGTDGREYPWGNTFDAAKCVCSVGNSRSSTAPVGSCPAGASPYGCMDMAGNVWEWCEDWYDNSQQYRVLRGGYWLYISMQTTSARRFASDSFPSPSLFSGFRVVFQGSVKPLHFCSFTLFSMLAKRAKNILRNWRARCARK